jgi:hypothetical protein
MANQYGTAVFNFVSGRPALQGFQVGPADIVNIAAASHSAWGWAGGFNGIKRIFSRLEHNPVSDSKLKSLAVNLELGPSRCYVLTSGGTFYFQDDSSENAFGGNSRTQLLGVTICALAHECGEAAIGLFMKSLAPFLLIPTKEDIAGVSEILYTELYEKFSQIVNEGAAYGLPQRFADAISDAALPAGDRAWLRKHQEVKFDPKTEPVFCELSLVGGLLRWLGQEAKGTYYTRSGLTARVAIYLKAVGYNIGTVAAWDGNQDKPAPLQGVILVTGGHSETDHFMLDAGDIVDTPYILQYRRRTVGAMFVNSLLNQSDIGPETFETRFESIDKFIKKNVSFEWKEKFPVNLCLVAQWQKPSSEPLAVRLASIYFPLLADNLAPCYEFMATDGVLETIQLCEDAMAGHDEFPTALVNFRVATACILFSIAGVIGGDGFDQLPHVTTLTLGVTDWIRKVSSCLDKAFSAGGGLPLWKAVVVVAAAHAAALPGEFLSGADNGRELDYIIGWRNGNYSVLPSILTHMTLGYESLGLVCGDIFYCQIPTHREGYIIGALPPPTIPSEDLLQRALSGASDSSQDPYIGPPEILPPDTPLYITFEKPFYRSTLGILFCGRVGGEVVGVAGIKDTLLVLLRSLDVPVACNGHQNIGNVLNVRAPLFSSLKRPTWSEQFNTYVSAEHDQAWAIFLAGMSYSFGGRISFGCCDCTVTHIARTGIRSGIIIGYHSHDPRTASKAEKAGKQLLLEGRIERQQD